MNVLQLLLAKYAIEQYLSVIVLTPKLVVDIPTVATSLFLEDVKHPGFTAF